MDNAANTPVNNLEYVDKKEITTFFTDKPKTNIQDKCQITMTNDDRLNIYHIQNFLDKIDCEHIIKRVDDKMLPMNFRSGSRCITFDSNGKLCNLIQSRLEHTVGGFLKKSNLQPYGFCLDYTFMQTNNINECLRFNKYEKGDSFNFHRDSGYVKTKYCRSNYTLLIYLNNGFEGGRTSFKTYYRRDYYNDQQEESKKHENYLSRNCGGKTITNELKHYNSENYYCDTDIDFPRRESRYSYLTRRSNMNFTPTTGSALIFDQRLIHAGKQIVKGVKYILRTDILTIGTPNNDIMTYEYTLAKQVAKLLFRQAQIYELDNNPKANELYQRALSLRVYRRIADKNTTGNKSNPDSEQKFDNERYNESDNESDDILDNDSDDVSDDVSVDVSNNDSDDVSDNRPHDEIESVDMLNSDNEPDDTPNDDLESTNTSESDNESDNEPDNEQKEQHDDTTNDTIIDELMDLITDKTEIKIDDNLNLIGRDALSYVFEYKICDNYEELIKAAFVFSIMTYTSQLVDNNFYSEYIKICKDMKIKHIIQNKNKPSFSDRFKQILDDQIQLQIQRSSCVYTYNDIEENNNETYLCMYLVDNIRKIRKLIDTNINDAIQKYVEIMKNIDRFKTHNRVDTQCCDIESMCSMIELETMINEYAGSNIYDNIEQIPTQYNDNCESMDHISDIPYKNKNNNIFNYNNTLITNKVTYCICPLSEYDAQFDDVTTCYVNNIELCYDNGICIVLKDQVKYEKLNNVCKYITGRAEIETYYKSINHAACQCEPMYISRTYKSSKKLYTDATFKFDFINKQITISVEPSIQL